MYSCNNEDANRGDKTTPTHSTTSYYQTAPSSSRQPYSISTKNVYKESELTNKFTSEHRVIMIAYTHVTMKLQTVKHTPLPQKRK